MSGALVLENFSREATKRKRIGHCDMGSRIGMCLPNPFHLFSNFDG